MRYFKGRHPRRDQGLIVLRSGINRLVDQQPRTIQGGDDAKGDDPRSAQRKSHRKARYDARKQTQKHDDQADLDPVQTE